jgi:hypothetical protein
MNANAKTAADPADERWIEWIEPFGPSNEPVYCRVPPATAIASQRRVADYPTDERALEDFMTVHWAERVPPPSVPQTLPPNDPPPPTGPGNERNRTQMNETQPNASAVPGWPVPNAQIHPPFIPFQDRATNWAMDCFAAEVVRNLRERGLRFLEEANELAPNVRGHVGRGATPRGLRSPTPGRTVRVC